MASGAWTGDPPGLSLADWQSPSRLEEPDLYKRWNLAADDLDAKMYLADLRSAWDSWTFDQRLLLVRAAESIAAAERAKLRRKLSVKETRRHMRLARECASVAATAMRLARAFPPPWDSSTVAVGGMIKSLIELAGGGLEDTIVTDFNVAIVVARQALSEFRAKTPKTAGRRVSWDLVGKLAWLANRQSGDVPDESDAPDESAVRRYASPRKTALPSSAKIWRKTFKLIVAGAQLLRRAGTPVDQRAFRPAIDYFLRDRAGH